MLTIKIVNLFLIGLMILLAVVFVFGGKWEVYINCTYIHVYKKLIKSLFIINNWNFFYSKKILIILWYQFLKLISINLITAVEDNNIILYFVEFINTVIIQLYRVLGVSSFETHRVYNISCLLRWVFLLSVIINYRILFKLMAYSI